MKIAILTRPQNASPKILAYSLRAMLERLGVEATVFEEALPMLGRLFPLTAKIRYTIDLHYRIREKLRYWSRDRAIVKELAKYDALIVSECCPNAFWRGYYDIEGFRRLLLGLPILYYEVYYLGCAPTRLERLQANRDYGIERYDWHLSVSPVNEVRLPEGPPWSAIGLDLRSAGLGPSKKPGFNVLVDFAQPGYEREREDQLAVLQQVGIKPMILSGSYEIANIREQYNEASVILMQFPESFGVSLAECLATGAYVFTPDSGWPMSFRLNSNPTVHGPGELPECFVTYNSRDDLKQKLLNLRSRYDSETEPFKVFEVFRKHYSSFYEGNLSGLKAALDKIREDTVCAR